MGPQGCSDRRRGRVPWLAATVLALVLASLGASAYGASDAPRARAASYPGKVPLGEYAVKVMPPHRLNPTNPLAGRPMGVYQGGMDQAWQPYVRAKGARKKLLARIALRPKAKWYGSWVGNGAIKKKVREYVANSQDGNPEALVQLTVFRMVPWEHAACKRLPTVAEKRSYRGWIRQFAAGVGDAHAAIILQPDGPFALCAPGGSRVPSNLIRYAAQRFSTLPNASVYIDAGTADWPKNDPAASARILRRAGVELVRGFALNSTHYVPVGWDINFGSQIIRELEAVGIHGKHLVINTSSNGRGFEFGKARGRHPDNAKVCATKTERRCVTLGIPPTTAVAARSWGLNGPNRGRAARNVDGYLWFGRPWLYMQNDPFSMRRALAVARTTPY
ncbi:MAG: glycoside hydrolase family 6 protein [Nocardioides sp.]|nr:glycoside hydrolase family 6 protein [Nocardioides sp.]